MDKKKYIEQEIAKILQSSGSLLFLFSPIVILSLSVLDYWEVPKQFLQFFMGRVASALIFITLYFINKKKTDKYFQFILTVIATVIAAVMVELMIFFTGGHQSPYYVGMIITFMFVLGFLPISVWTAILLAAIINAIYLLPILMFDTITNLPVFISNISFMTATAVIGFMWRYITHSLLISKLSLEYDLSQDKEQLQQYSIHLEDLVAERTQELAASEQRYRELFDSANDGIVVFDENRIVIDVNRQFCEIYGCDKSSMIGVNLDHLEVEDYQGQRSERMKRILNGEALVFETEHYKQNGDRVIVEVSSKAIEIGGKVYVQSFHRDVTDKKKLLTQLFQSQKMESIGVLAGGIAHDFNNFLSVILGHAELLAMNEELDATSRRGIKIIASTSRKAGQIVSKLLSFARKGKFVALPLNFNDVLKDAVELLERVAEKKKIELKVETDNNVPIIKGDGTQLEQVIMNLVMNATDAMPEGGIITISTSLKTIEKNHAVIHPLLTPGKYVSMKVKDTGTGIPDDIRERIFDPFFTTKGPEKGTGLGLAIIYGIVREHNGVITVSSIPGSGTTFEVYLPLIEPGIFA